LITAICSPIWYGSDGAKIWSDAAINILPNLMGFSIAGMAILLALSNPTAMRAITEDGEPRSYFTETIANFFHFILVQTVALILGFVGKHYSFVALSALGVLFLTYAILVGLAMAMQLLQTARIVNASSSLDNLPARQFRRPHLTTPKKVNTNHVRR
jgi:hypothetical protein